MKNFYWKKTKIYSLSVIVSSGRFLTENFYRYGKNVYKIENNQLYILGGKK